MTQMTLYSGGGISLSPNYEEGRTESEYVRLMADDGKTLQKGKIITSCVDVLTSDIANWTEIDEPEPEPEPEELLSILLGGDSE